MACHQRSSLCCTQWTRLKSKYDNFDCLSSAPVVVAERIFYLFIFLKISLSQNRFAVTALVIAAAAAAAEIAVAGLVLALA